MKPSDDAGKTNDKGRVDVVSDKADEDVFGRARMVAETFQTEAVADRVKDINGHGERLFNMANRMVTLFGEVVPPGGNYEKFHLTIENRAVDLGAAWDRLRRATDVITRQNLTVNEVGAIGSMVSALIHSAQEISQTVLNCVGASPEQDAARFKKAYSVLPFAVMDSINIMLLDRRWASGTAARFLAKFDPNPKAQRARRFRNRRRLGLRAATVFYTDDYDIEVLEKLGFFPKGSKPTEDAIEEALDAFLSAALSVAVTVVTARDEPTLTSGLDSIRHWTDRTERLMQSYLDR